MKNNIDFNIYINILKSYDSNISITENKKSVDIKYNNIKYHVDSLNEFNDVLKKIIKLPEVDDKETLFNECNKLTNFIIKNSKYKVILDNVLPNNQDFKNLFMMAIYIKNSKNIFNSIDDNEIKKINYENINVILSDFIINNNNKELISIKYLEGHKDDLESKLNNLQTVITELTKEKIQKENEMYEKNLVMKYYDEFKQVSTQLNNIINQINIYDKNKMSIKIKNINYQREIDNLYFEKNKISKNFLLKFFNKKRINRINISINEIIDKINENSASINNYKKQNHDLKNKKEILIKEFCDKYNTGMSEVNKKDFDFNDIKVQFKKIKEFNEFKKQFELDGYCNRRNELKNKLIDINEKTKYKTKFYLVYQIKSVSDIMKIPIEEVLNKEYLDLLYPKKVDIKQK